MFGQPNTLSWRSSLPRPPHRGGNSAKATTGEATKQQNNEAMMKRKMEQVVPYLSFRNSVLTIPGYRFSEVLTCLYHLDRSANISHF